jgi:serine/threonine protein phosphatase PrpC
MRFASFTHRGNVREINEDSVFIPPAGAQPPYYFLAVADGMGGHNAGEVASAMAIRSMVNLLDEEHQKGRLSTDPVKTLRRATIATNDKVYLLGKQSRRFAGMGTTLTAALCLTDQILVAHVGDSRAYLLRDDEGIRRITHDHTLVQEFLDHNVLTAEQAQNDPRRNVLTRALGTEAGQTPDMFETPWGAGDTLLLCSDGLTAFVSDDEIGAIIRQTKNPDDAANMLGNLALARGGGDNISLCLACWGGNGR